MTRTFLILLLLLAPTLVASEIYKWQDENGHWHFEDQPPDGKARYETIGVPRQSPSMVSVRRGGERHEPQHFFLNQFHGPAQVEVTLPEAENVRAHPALPARFVIPGNEERGLVMLAALDATEGFSYRLSYTVVPGAPMTDLPADLDFYPPFARGKQYPISQGMDDSETHKDAANRYAVDIVMPIGTPVLAARGGVVMDSEQDHPDTGGKDERFLSQANFLRILHDDGTMGVYAHLQRNSLRVTPGMRIPAGHWIANSGNSGYSSGPHLHFVVQINIGMALESLPLRFKRPLGGTMDPDRPQMLDGVLAAGR